MRYAILGLIAAVGLFTGAATAAEPTPRQLELSANYLKVMKLRENMESSMKTSMPSTIDAVAKGLGIPDRLKPLMTEVITESMGDMMPKMFAAMERAAAETYSEEELTAVIGFYETPIGQSIITKTPGYNARLLPAVTNIMVEYQRTVMKATAEKLCGDGQCQAKPPLPSAGAS